MRNQPKNKSWPLIIVIVAVAVIVYFAFFAGTPDTSDMRLLETGPENGEVGVEILGLLNQIQSLQIDPKFFENPAYRYLQDYTIEIPPENVGRENPFAPI